MPNLITMVCEQHPAGAKMPCVGDSKSFGGPRANVTVSVGRYLFEQQQNPYFTKSFQFQKQTPSEVSLFN